MTGESELVSVAGGDKILSGSINEGEVIELKATELFENSTVSRILTLIEEATDKKANSETMVARISKVYTPVIILFAVVITILLPVLGVAEFSESLYRGLTFLVISCPCAIAISVPLSYFVGIGMASKNNVLIKGSNYLDNLMHLKKIIFDKTGTLTTGSFNVTNIEIFDDNYTEKDIIEILTKGESFSNHPIAKSIMKLASEKVNDEELDDILIGKFERGEYKIFGTTENGHKSEQGAPILNIKRKTNEINKTNEHVENESNKEKFEKDLLSQNITEKYLNMPREELEEKFGSEFLKTVDFGSQNNNSHQYELFEHILRTVDSVNTDKLSEKDALKVKVAAFFHDIGKPNVAQLNEKTGQTQFIGHAKQSAEIAKDILGNIGYNEQEIAELSFLIQSHDDFIPIAKKEDITEERISKVLESTMKKAENY